MFQCGPYGPTHATAGTFAFKRELLSITRYNENACIAEEKEFLKDYTIPFVQLDPMKTILVFSHNHNTYDKRRLLENASGHNMKKSNKTVEMFIKFTDEAKIKRFFLKDIDEKLAKYEPGLPNMKPDVLKQTAELDEKRLAQKSSQSMLVLQAEGKDPIHLGPHEVLNIINNLRDQIKTITDKNADLERKIADQKVVTFSDPIEQPSNNVQKLRKEISELESRLKLANFVETELRTEIEFLRKPKQPSITKSMVTIFPPEKERLKSVPEVRVQI
jgi:hypothetical protein